MITINRFIDSYRSYHDGQQPFRLLQDQAAILINSCQTTYRPIADALEITPADIDWVLQQPEANEDYADLFGGEVHICQSEADLKQIVGIHLRWAASHDDQWPNVTDLPMAWDSCTYLTETSGDPEWVLFLLCWNDAGGPVYYVPKSLWQSVRQRKRENRAAIIQLYPAHNSIQKYAVMNIFQENVKTQLAK